MKTHLKSKTRRGFTLIELMVVVLIIAVLAALVVPKVQENSKQAKIGAAKSQIGRISSILQQFRLDCDRYPTSEEGLGALVSQPADATGWKGPYLDKIPLDPWDQDFVYLFPGPNTEDSFQLISNGNDKANGTDDDISNLDL
jgi:general secretion pathway protein G